MDNRPTPVCLFCSAAAGDYKRGSFFSFYNISCGSIVEDALCQALLGIVDFPVRPPANANIPEFDLRTPKINNPANERRPFVWRYLDWPRPWKDKDGTNFTSFPLAVASLSEPFQGVRHFLNAFSIFELMPQKMKAATLLANHEEFDLFLSDLGVPSTEIIWANVSMTWAKKKDTQEFTTSSPNFLLKTNLK